MKGYERCMWQLEGCMAKGYVMEVSMGFIIEYLQDFQAMTWKVWDVEEEEGVSREVLEGASSQIVLDPANWDMAHHYVLINTNTMADWVK